MSLFPEWPAKFNFSEGQLVDYVASGLSQMNGEYFDTLPHELQEKYRDTAISILVKHGKIKLHAAQ